MNIAELYGQTPVERQENIKVVGERVFSRNADGSLAEYLMSSDGELWLIRSDRELRQDIQAIKAKLGI